MSSADAATPPPVNGRRQRPVRSLLDSLLAESLDPSYAAAAQRRAAMGGSAQPRWRHVIGVLTFAMAGLMLVLSAQQAQARLLPAAQNRETLVAEIGRRDQAITAADAEVRALRADVARSRAAALPGDNAPDAPLNRLGRAQLASSTVAVEGPGILLRVDDAPSTGAAGSLDPRREDTIDEGRVLDRDLQGVVNGLWAAGAEAVSVGDQRLSSLSAIRAAGLAILVDYKYVLPPYEIHAVGDPEALRRAVEEGPSGEQLRNLRDDVGIVFTVERDDKLVLPGADPGPLRWAEPVLGPTRSPDTTSRRQEGSP